MNAPNFNGFPPQSRLVRIPEIFFQEVLPFIEDINELKITLYTLWYLERLEQSIKYLSIGDYLRDPRWMQSFGKDGNHCLISGLEKAIGRGTLISTAAPTLKDPQILIFANTKRSRAICDALHAKKITTADLLGDHIQLDILRPNIFELYEQNIGPITPMIAEILKDAESNYPSAWIEEAIELAIQNNSRRWRYIEGILKRWKENGRDG